MKRLLIAFLLLSLVACQSDHSGADEANAKGKNEYSFPIQSLTDTEYPDDPDIGYRHSEYENIWFESGDLLRKNDSFVFKFKSKGNDSVQLILSDLNEFIPTVPSHLRGEEYLTKLALINQEWNRNQVSFGSAEFQSSDKRITRVDLARNCLNSYLWEVIAYAEENGEELPLSHGWFNFPKPLYQALFKERNQLDFEEFAPHLERWKTPESKTLNTLLIRTVANSIPVTFKDQSNEMYPLKKARLKKRKEVIYPINFEKMTAFHTDGSLFATFTPPGFYNKLDPRKTQLGRLKTLKNVQAFKTISTEAKLERTELQLTFEDGERTTNFIIGGIELDQMPRLPAAEANDGWKQSMGFGNHTFYETKMEHYQTHSAQSPFYAYLTDHKGRWLDSHEIGIDGPIIHWDDQDSNKLHVWFLSFERHALVGYYTISFIE